MVHTVQYDANLIGIFSASKAYDVLSTEHSVIWNKVWIRKASIRYYQNQTTQFLRLYVLHAIHYPKAHTLGDETKRPTRSWPAAQSYYPSTRTVLIDLSNSSVAEQSLTIWCHLTVLASTTNFNTSFCLVAYSVLASGVITHFKKLFIAPRSSGCAANVPITWPPKCNPCVSAHVY